MDFHRYSSNTCTVFALVDDNEWGEIVMVLWWRANVYKYILFCCYILLNLLFLLTIRRELKPFYTCPFVYHSCVKALLLFKGFSQ